jgi:hypothetical protein
MINPGLLIIGKMKKVVFLILIKVMIYGSLLKMFAVDFCPKISLLMTLLPQLPKIPSAIWQRAIAEGSENS